MKIDFDNTFDEPTPWMLYPDVHTDNRGSFSEVMKKSTVSYMYELKQINRSISCKGTLRGFHAQKAPFCQAKLVEALNMPIYDIIIDARPDRKTFGKSQAYLLKPDVQNKLFVPRGFLHAFYVPADDTADNASAMAVFMYYCDNEYDKESEVGVSPASVLDKIRSDNPWLKFILNADDLVLSERDLKGMDYETFMKNVNDEYEQHGNLWYQQPLKEVAISA
jgi:dTDP-4-dehydrorhamnose 3,5-epimerase